MQLLVRGPWAGLRAVEAHEGATVAAVCGLDNPAAAAVAHGAGLRIVCGGRTLNPFSTVAAEGLPPCATLQLVPRLRGGGGDGGSTGAESRSSYLEMYMGKRPDKADPESERRARWTTCQLSGMPLQPPCVADELGSLFNKDAVLQALLSKSMPKSLSHISSLKHLIELKLEAAVGGEQGPGEASLEGVTRFACPVTGQALNGKSRFVVMRRSGHVVSERALKEVPAVVEELVGGKWGTADLLPVNPPADEQQEMREQLLLKRTAERLAKKGKKGKDSKDKVAAAACAVGDGAAAANGTGAGNKRAAGDAGGTAAAAAAANGGAAAGPGAGVAKKFKAAELKPAGADDTVWNSLFTSSVRNTGSSNDFFTRAANRGA